MDKIKMIKKDALIEIKIGTGFFSKLQQLYFFMLSSLTPEQVEKYKTEGVANKSFSEPWMDHILTLTILMTQLEKAAEEQDHTYEKDFEEGLKELENSIEE